MFELLSDGQSAVDLVLSRALILRKCKPCIFRAPLFLPLIGINWNPYARARERPPLKVRAENR